MQKSIDNKKKNLGLGKAALPREENTNCLSSARSLAMKNKHTDVLSETGCI